MEEEILLTLQAKWEARLLETRVADFARAPGSSSSPEPGQAGEDGNVGVEGPSPNLTLPINPLSSPPGGNIFTPSNQGLALPGRLHNSDVQIKAEPSDDPLRLRGGASEDVKPNLDPNRPEPNAAGLLPGDDIIDSDLDDSDDELRDDAEGGDDDGDTDIVFCVYDKVQRVKNKWKTVFKDGMIHVNGRDYLFSKCTGEFEW
ncbi:uncharacterized protein I206_104966 [Kwoniella pini CBS 10737]|uniref:Transcription initiation factor TFIIA large subunit n=1 Tax=Kwoniella pini CBS 10737 TaxID=1296096 RepID=A0A1B9I8F2_9TREE|nr:uncharacterized protein I206_02505 [Kwoniella pini CBS 10737]OCF51789.1 hypothetical protein I206_02505 [Kwoniella pini CBS 10737]